MWSSGGGVLGGRGGDGKGDGFPVLFSKLSFSLSLSLSLPSFFFLHEREDGRKGCSSTEKTRAILSFKNINPTSSPLVGKGVAWTFWRGKKKKGGGGCKVLGGVGVE